VESEVQIHRVNQGYQGILALIFFRPPRPYIKVLPPSVQPYDILTALCAGL
jgi:hypothetical protein